MKCFAALGPALIVTACATTTYVAPPDPTPVIGAQLIGPSGECVDVLDGGTADGTPIQVFQCHGSPNQRWYIRNGVISENYGSCIDVQGGAPADGAPIVLMNCTGGTSQQWSITDGLIVGLGGKCLSESGGMAANLTPLVLWSCGALPGQQWIVK